MPEITFEYGTPYLAECYGGIETYNCKEQAIWTQNEEGHRVALLCNSCKCEVETYIKNQ